MHNHHRRRKKRPNYGTRTVEVSRGFNGFGFTISGQQPCILSCIVANSPADLAGLRAGDFLISVNGLNVSKLPHESVVQLIGNSLGTIRMQIAEHYFSDSSDEENIVNHVNRGKPRYLHHKLKMNRMRSSPHKLRDSEAVAAARNGICEQQHLLRPVIEDVPLPPPVAAHSIIHSPNASTSKDISNVSAMVRKSNESAAAVAAMEAASNGTAASLEYRAIVGYLGTIEMPKQIATSSKLQTVRSCIRKMRQEKRNPTTVLMTILPNCLTLRNSSSTILATYPASRLNYVSSSSESENRFFGLVTSAIYANLDDDPIPLDEALAIPQNARDIIISNSCHVFVIDTKICDHSFHEQKTTEFKIHCTKDPIANLCLEFPNNSEYVVNLIRSMYTMKVLPPSVRHAVSYSRNHHDHHIDAHNRNIPDALMQANSPQPSNHSEVTTTSSNSDSGIGFHNDCTNISDRIVVVDFPGLMINRTNHIGSARPLAIHNNIEPVCEPLHAKNEIVQPTSSSSTSNHIKSKSVDLNTRLTVRAMPDPKVPKSPQKGEIPDLIANFNEKNPTTLTTTRSCDDVITSVERDDDCMFYGKKQLQMSIDDITMLSGSGHSQYENHIFMQPRKPVKKSKKSSTAQFKDDGAIGLQTDSKLMMYKLSPKVFGVSRPNSMSFENLPRESGIDVDKKNNSQEKFEIWGSLQELHKSGAFETQTGNVLEGTYSEPDLLSRALPSTASSPFRRWGQSSFRTPRSNEPRTPLARRPSSLAASENDVYTKSIDDYGDDLDSQRSRSGELTGLSSAQNITENAGVSAWGSSFEKLLEDSAGIHTFAEFLKKEFSAENIYFWTACERYRQIDDDNLRAGQAIEIFSKHLATGGLEPVNVDSQARNIAEDNLQCADRNLFGQAQKQIFNLMKFDSYQRFIRSDLYKNCLEAETKNLPLPYPGGEQLDELLRTNLIIPTPSKLKKSLSNAEDRRRKSLLPWHRKTRCKSRDRSDADYRSNIKTSGKSSGNSLKPHGNNSTSDIHSSRSSLSSFDAAAAAAIGTSCSDDAKSCSLCRVILNDGATTVVQTRENETVRQLVERLLEKRGIHYPFFDVLLNGNTKAFDLENPATLLAGKEVQIEQRVAFKLDLPDPKVISVKSKPKKALGDVLRPILHKYNYRLEDVQVLLRENHEQLEMGLPVTVADGQRLQVVLLKQEAGQYDQNQQARHRQNHAPIYKNPNLQQIPIPSSFQSSKGNNNKLSNQQNTLDEITNKVFNELLQGKVDSHAGQGPPAKPAEQCSIKSEDCASETSSIFGRLRRRDSNIPGVRGIKPKKLPLPSKSSTAGSEDGLSTCTPNTSASIPDQTGIKKPLIAKWKTGVKLQSTGRSENHEEFLEGLKRAQRARLEDQRGTEINFELPDFLKDKENLSVVNKLRKTRNCTLPENSDLSATTNNPSSMGLQRQISNEPIPSARSNFDALTSSVIMERPQPAPRLSIAKSASSKCVSPMKIDLNNGPEIVEENLSPNNSSSHSNDIEFDLCHSKGPPPLPPKPKILPIKPSNWGQSTAVTTSINPTINSTTPPAVASSLLPSKIPVDMSRRHLGSSTEQNGRNIYLDQPSSSFV